MGFDELQISADLMHSWHLGVGRDVGGSALKWLITQRFWPGATHDQRLAAATTALKGWAKQNGVKVVLSRFTKPALNWKSDELLGMKRFTRFSFGTEVP